MKKIIMIVIVVIGLSASCFAEKIIYDKYTGLVLRYDHDSIQWNSSYIGGQQVISPVDWTQISIGQGQDIHTTVIEYVINPTSGLPVEVVSSILKTNVSQISDFIDLKVAADAKAAAVAQSIAVKSYLARQIANKYGITNSPIDWDALWIKFEELSAPYAAVLMDPASTDLQKNTAIQLMNPITTDSQRAVGYSLFLIANGADITAIP